MSFSLAPLKINDVTTTPDSPPSFRTIARARGGEMPYPAENGPLQKAAYPDLRPLRLSVPAAKAFEKAHAIILELGWRLISADAATGALEATASTRLLRFKDDVIIEIREVAGGAEVHMRSKSRLGKGDLGANAHRIRDFLRRFG